MKLSDYQQQSARHILIYGPPKSGKTVMIAKLAKHFKLWWLDFEDGIKSVLNPDVFDQSLLDNIELFSIPDKTTYPMAVETMLKVIKMPKSDICHAHGKVSCPQCKAPGQFSTLPLADFDVKKDILVVETWSQLSESVMNYIMREAIAKENYDAKAGWDEYGKQGRILERIASTIQVAPFNIIVSSHEMMVEMEDGSKKIVPIGGTSNFSKTFAKYFDDVVYMEVFNKQHRGLSSTTAKANVLAGSRRGVELKTGDTLARLFGIEEAASK